jgi:putative Mg2+ transporter-C (MgtC) family protein
MNILTSDLIKLSIAVLVGGVIGLEREFQYKAAGFRTIILITLGSTLYTIFSVSLAAPNDSVTRIASNIVTGIGFLGAGTILREGGRIGGLTTAATIWLAAALGMGIGAGAIDFVLAATVVTLIILLIFPRMVAWIEMIREARTYKIEICAGDITRISQLRQVFKDCNLRVSENHVELSAESVVSEWRTVGTPRNQEKFVKLMVQDKTVCRLEY